MTQSKPREIYWGMRERALFMVDNGVVTAQPKPPLNATIKSEYTRGVNYEVSNVSVFEEHIQYHGGGEEHRKGYWIHSSKGSTSLHYVKPSDEKHLPPIGLARYYRTLIAIQKVSEVLPPRDYKDRIGRNEVAFTHRDCIFYADARLAVGEPYSPWKGADVEVEYDRAVLYVTTMLAGNYVPNDMEAIRKLTIPHSGLERLNEIKQLKVPNLDNAIEACMEFSIPFDLNELDRELRQETLEESELVRKVLALV